MNLQFYAQTLKGDQSVNQDTMAHSIDNDSAFFVVADGLGGHSGGEIISRAFCESLHKTAKEYKTAILKTGQVAMASWFNHAIGLMNEQLIQTQCSQQANTTCAILWIDPQQVITAHLGDSRIYRFNDNQRLWRTRDHSVPQMLVDEGEITENQMGTHPDQNRLTRSINRRNTHQPSIKQHSGLKTGDTFLLCTDGFWAYSKEEELAILAETNTTEQQLQAHANTVIKRANGKSDNVSWQWISHRRD